MRFRELRSILQRVVLAGLPAAACSNAPGSQRSCSTPGHLDATIATPATPAMQLKIDSCRVDADACPDLCDAIMSANSIGGSRTKCAVTFDSGHAYVSIDYQSFPCGTGRTPVGLAPPHDRRAPTAAGAWLAHAAWLEAASVPAFAILARELAAHGAPRALVDASIVAAHDEVRHAALVGALARRYGARPQPAEVEDVPARTLEALAIENAVEGCVRETYGAMLASWQARTAADADVRDGFATIARDELRHAALGWTIDRWARTRLDAAARARVLAARAIAARALLAAPLEPELPALGLPDPATLLALRGRTYDALWTGGDA